MASSTGHTTADMTVGALQINNTRSSLKLAAERGIASVNMESVSIYDDFGTPSALMRNPHMNVTEIHEESTLLKNSFISEK